MQLNEISNALKSELMMMSIVEQCIEIELLMIRIVSNAKKLNQKCIGFKLLMISIVVQCIGMHCLC